ncbi:hypothetical protein ACH5RR_001971 [Cinchona calisaya]|uniref:Uncharacterized protein n=1 Tax=Cinchona calisaya TaxID=153742 RepID=A0ABD3B4Y0_9GENT
MRLDSSSSRRSSKRGRSSRRLERRKKTKKTGETKTTVMPTTLVDHSKSSFTRTRRYLLNIKFKGEPKFERKSEWKKEIFLCNQGYRHDNKCMRYTIYSVSVESLLDLWLSDRVAFKEVYSWTGEKVCDGMGWINVKSDICHSTFLWMG